MIRNTTILAFVGATLACSETGCSSMKTRIYDYDETGMRNKTCLSGIPETIEVPTHVKLEIIETVYYHKEVENPNDAAKKKVNYVLIANASMGNGIVSRSVNSEFIKMKELYTVDLKRPAAGTAEIGVTYGDNSQSFSKVTHKTDDQTIAKVAALVQAAVSVAPQLAKAATNTEGEGATSSIVGIPHTVVSTVFDLRTPGIETRVQEFLDEHVNRCTKSCSTPVCNPPGTTLPLPAPSMPIALPGSIPNPR